MPPSASGLGLGVAPIDAIFDRSSGAAGGQGPAGGAALRAGLLLGLAVWAVLV